MNPTVRWLWLCLSGVLCILPLARFVLCCGGALLPISALVALYSEALTAVSSQRHRTRCLEGAGARVSWWSEIDPKLGARATGRSGVWFLCGSGSGKSGVDFGVPWEGKRTCEEKQGR